MEVKENFLALGVECGDSIYTHANIGFFGSVLNVNNRQSLCQFWLDNFLDVIGNGSLIVPTFTYSFGNDQSEKVFNVNETSGVGGLLSEFVRNDNASFRTDDPMFSVSVIGDSSSNIVDNVSSDITFGNGSIWSYLLKSNALLLNLNQDIISTFIHYIESVNKVPYRKDMSFEGTVVYQDDRKEHRKVIFNCRDFNRNDNITKCNRVSVIAHKENLAKTVKIGKGTATSIRARDYYELVTYLLDKDINFLIK